MLLRPLLRATLPSTTFNAPSLLVNSPETQPYLGKGSFFDGSRIEVHKRKQDLLAANHGSTFRVGLTTSLFNDSDYWLGRGPNSEWSSICEQIDPSIFRDGPNARQPTFFPDVLSLVALVQQTREAYPPPNNSLAGPFDTRSSAIGSPNLDSAVLSNIDLDVEDGFTYNPADFDYLDPFTDGPDEAPITRGFDNYDLYRTTSGGKLPTIYEDIERDESWTTSAAIYDIP